MIVHRANSLRRGTPRVKSMAGRDVRLRVAELGDLRKGWQSLRLKPNDTATVLLAGRPVITDGQVIVRQVAYGPQQHQVEIIISSQNFLLNHSTVDPPKQYSNSNLQQIANEIT